MPVLPESPFGDADRSPELAAHPRARRLLIALWPGFVAACVLELAVFAFVDPSEMHWLGQHVDWPRQAVYALAFFAFWAIAAAACAVAVMLALEPPLTAQPSPDAARGTSLAQTPQAARRHRGRHTQRRTG